MEFTDSSIFNKDYVSDAWSLYSILVCGRRFVESYSDIVYRVDIVKNHCI